MKNMVRMVQTVGCNIKKRENQWNSKRVTHALSIHLHFDVDAQ